jgi:aminoglycoside 3-N-acetyltransferase I
MTNRETSEVLLYDIAVVPEHQRKGIGRRLLEELLSLTSREGCSVVFVLADDADQEALDFYRKLGAEATQVTLFSYSPGERRRDKSR